MFFLLSLIFQKVTLKSFAKSPKHRDISSYMLDRNTTETKLTNMKSTVISHYNHH